MSHIDPSSVEFFELKYRGSEDPWKFADSEYERRRFDAIMIALSGRMYAAGFEPGCSIGVLTRMLAAICASVTACDISQTAIMSARERCRENANVRVLCCSLSEWEDLARFDLVVWSEIGYYFTMAEWAALSERLIGTMSSGATLLACHWLGDSNDHKTHGDDVHRVLEESSQLRHQFSERNAQFRIDRWTRI
jgi:SAM-dependent methyltransferase